MQTKSELRAFYRAQRKALDPAAQAVRDAELLSRLLTLPEYSRCGAVYTYIAKPGEVDTHPLIRAAWANGKRVAAPRWDAAHEQLRFYWLSDAAQLAPGAFGVMEPIPACPPADSASAADLCIVPGLAFDAAGYRLGYGKGCYDRYLPEFAGISVGVCGAAAVELHLPHDSLDVPVQLLVTERYVRRIAAASGFSDGKEG